jgi:hypothetical protein
MYKKIRPENNKNSTVIIENYKGNAITAPEDQDVIEISNPKKKVKLDPLAQGMSEPGFMSK